MKVFIVAVAVLAFVALMEPVVRAQERTDPGTMSADRFSPLNADRVKTHDFSALKFGASVLDVSNLAVKRNARLDIPGGAKFVAGKTQIGGSKQAGPISISTGVNDVVLNSAKNTQFKANKDINGVIEGSVVQIDAFDDVIVSAPKGDARLNSEAIAVEGTDRGVKINAQGGDVTFTNVNETSSRFAINSGEVTLNSQTSTSFVSNSSISVGAARNADIAGGSVTIKSAEATTLDAAIGSIFVDSLTQVRMAASEVEFNGDSGVHVTSFGGDVAVTGTEPTSSVTLGGANSVQLEARQNGLNLTTNTGDLDVTVANIEFDFVGSASFTGDGGADISADSAVVVLATSKTIIKATTKLNLVSTGDGTTRAVKINAKGPAISFLSRGGDLGITAYDVILKSTGATTVTANTALNIVGDISASLSGGTIAVTTTGATADILLDSGHSFTGTAANDIKFATTNGAITLQSPKDIIVSAVTGSTVKGTQNDGVKVVSNEDTHLIGGNVKLHAGDDVVITNTDSMLLSGATVSIAPTTTSKVTSNELIQFQATGGQLTVTAKTTADFEALRSTMQSDFTALTSTTATTIKGKTGVDLDALRSVTTKSALNTDVVTDAGVSILAPEGNILYTTEEGGIVWDSSTNRFSARRDLSIAYGKIHFTTNTGIDFRAAGGIHADAGTSITVDPEQVAQFTALEDITLDALQLLTVKAATSITGNAETVEFHSTGDSKFSGNAGNVFFRSGVIGAGDIDTVGYSTAAFIAKGPASNDALSFDADETVSWNGQTGLSFTSADQTTTRSGTGQDIKYDSGNDIKVTAGADLKFISEEFYSTFDEEALINGGTVDIQATNPGTTTQNDVFIRASRFLDVQPTTKATIQGDSTQLAGHELVRILGGTVLVESTTDPKTITVEADGGGSRWSSNTDKDISFTATVAFTSSAVDTIKGVAADGKILIRATRDIHINQGTTLMQTGEGEELLAQSAGGLLLTTDNEEAIVLDGDRELLFDSTAATTLSSTFASPPQTPTNTDFLDETTRFDYFEPNDVAILHETRDGDVCINNDRDDGSHQITFVGGFGVGVAATGFGGDVEMRSAKHITSTAASLGISSDGWAYDPLGIVGLDYKVGAILRTTSATKPLVLNANAAGIYMYGEDGLDHRTVTGKYTLTGRDFEVRVKDFTDKASFIAELGQVKLETTADSLIRAGTPTVDGSIRLNATNTASFTSAAAVSITQHGSSTDADRTGIRFYSEQGTLKVKGGSIVLDADSNGGGRVDAIAQTGAMTFSNQGAGNLELKAQNAHLSIQGQRGLSTKANANAYFIRAAGPEGSLNIDSAGDQAITFNMLGTDNVQGQLKSTANFFLEAFAGVFTSSNKLDMTSTTDMRVAAGGSLSVISETDDVDVTSISNIRSEAGVQSTFDATTHVTISKLGAAQTNLMRVGAGGSPVTSGTVINALGRIELGLEDNTREAYFDAEGINMQSAAVVSFHTKAIRATTTEGLVRFETQNGNIKAFSGKKDFLVLSTGKMDISTLDNIIELTSELDNAMDAIVNVNSAVKVFASAAGDLSVIGEDRVHMFHGDFLIDVPQTVTFKSVMADLDVQSDALLTVSAVTGMLFEATTGENGIIAETKADNADIILETHSSTLSHINIVGTKNVLFDGDQGATLHGESAITTLAQKNVLLTSANNLTVVSYSNAVDFTAKLTSLIQTPADEDLVVYSDGDVVATAGGKIQLTAIKNINLQGDGRIAFVSTGTNTELIQSDATVDLSASNDISIQTATGQPYNIEAKNAASFTSIEENPAGNGITVTSATTFDVESVAKDVLYTSQGNLNVESNNLLKLQGDAVGATANGVGGVLVSSAGPDGIKLLSTAQNVQFTALRDIDATFVRKIVATTTEKTLITSTHELGDIVIRSVSKVEAIAGQQAKLHAFGKGTNQGRINIESKSKDVVIVSANNVNMIGNREVLVASTDAMNIGANIAVQARNNILLEAQATGSPVAFQVNGAGSAILLQTLGEETSVIMRSGAGATLLTAPEIKANVKFNMQTFSGGVTSLNSATSATFISTSANTKMLVESERRDVLVDGKFTATVTKDIDVLTPGTIRVSDASTLNVKSLSTALDIRGEDGVRFGDLVTGIVAGTGVAVSAANSISVTATTRGLTFTPQTAVLTTTGPLADIVLNSEGQMSMTGTSISMYAETNLGNLGAMIRTKSYNHNAFEFMAIDGKMLVTAGTTMNVQAEQGSIELFGAESIKYTGTNLGFMGRAASPQQNFANAGNFCNGQQQLVCPGHEALALRIHTAWNAYGFRT